MKRLAQVTAIALLMGFSPSSDGSCPLPDGWQLATDLKPSPVPYELPLVFYAKESQPGGWSWVGTPVTYERLLENVAVAGSLDPKPFLLFSFVEGQDCSQLTAVRKAIAAAAKCTSDNKPCLEGTIEEYRVARDEPA